MFKKVLRAHHAHQIYIKTFKAHRMCHIFSITSKCANAPTHLAVGPCGRGLRRQPPRTLDPALFGSGREVSGCLGVSSYACLQCCQAPGHLDTMLPLPDSADPPPTHSRGRAWGSAQSRMSTGCPQCLDVHILRRECNSVKVSGSRV
jgi:hypothetical protein